ncbi:MAG: polyprenyl diphosphate synthase [Macromonas sp.]
MTHDPSIPYHVAIVMDGNGRWAKSHFLPRLVGHRQGVEVLCQMVRWAQQRDVRVLTVFAFSSENWRRPPDEVSGLMSLVIKALSSYVPEMCDHGVRIHFLGQRSTLASEVQQALQQAEDDTVGNDRLVLNICFNYGGRWDMVQAAQALAARGEAITEQSLSQALALSHVPDPDLLIRTGGEQRLSNFLLWQAAYSELFFSNKWWPEFDEAEFDRALLAYAQRERRFGRTSEQL